jgi:branched-chain amino acid aminotransferase
MPLQGGCDVPLTPTEKIWMDGELVDWDQAKIHVLTHSLHYGLGVFEGIRAYPTSQGPAVFRLTDHIARLFASAKILGITIPFTTGQIIDAVKKVVVVSGLEGCYIRPIVYLGYGEMGLNPMQCGVNVAIACWSWGAYLGDEGIQNGIRLKVSSWARHDSRAMPTAAKATGMYINSSLAKVEAVRAGYDEAVMLTTDGHLSEGTGENVFVVRHGRLLTPAFSSAGALEGITASSVRAIAQDLGYDVAESNLRRTDLYLAEEAFLCGTAAEVVPIASVDDRPVGSGKPGPITKAIQDVFFQAVRGEVDRYKDWVEHVT